ncbi:MAG: carboxypeptidase-like regulatory domain-containing protein [Prevotellaceae bacterium]|jgi:outer membrane biosynthesis protein TonB|nr:carboxypeptidase-like regulatory domain-containing protein [Prevotellaceae bacterium]
MNLLQYIKGIRNGKEINRLEREAMKDPLMADALDGFDKVAGNHEQRIKKMRTEILYKTRQGNKHILRYCSIAASILLITGIGGYFLLNDNQPAKENIAKELILPETKQPEIKQPETEQPEVKQPPKKPLLVQANVNKEKEQDSTPLSYVRKEVAVVNETIDTDKSKVMPPQKQRGKITGIVVDSDGIPLPGAAVIYSGTNTGVSSNQDGFFELPESTENEIMVDLIGYERVKLAVDTNRTMLVAMKEESAMLEDVTVVAFGTQKKENVIGSVTTQIKKDENVTDSVSTKTKKNVKSNPVIGKKEYQKYLKTNIVMPQSENCKGKKGAVKLIFSVNAAGRPVNIRVKKSLCPEADKESVRLLEQGPDWTPGNREIEIEVKFKF